MANTDITMCGVYRLDITDAPVHAEENPTRMQHKKLVKNCLHVFLGMQH